MRRLLRILLNAATVLSLVLCVVTVATWVRSYFVSDRLEWFDRDYPVESSIAWSNVGYTREIELGRGGFRLTRSHVHHREGFYRLGHVFNWFRSSPRTYPFCGFADLMRHANHSAIGFQFVLPKASEDENRGDVYWVRSITIPLFAVACLTSILPLLWVGSWRITLLRRLRQRAGVCTRCGYDLRATPDRCPECGTPAAAG